MAELSKEQMQMVQEAVKRVGAYGEVKLVIDSDDVATIEAKPSIMILRGGKPIKRPKDN